MTDTDYKTLMAEVAGVVAARGDRRDAETVKRLADAVEALLREDPALARRELSDLTEEYIALQEQHREALKALGESRARFAEAAIQKVRGLIRERTFAETLATDFDGNLWPQMVNMDDLRAILAESPSVVLQDRDREVAARALEQFADALGVDAGDEDSDELRGYRNGQRQALHEATKRAAAYRADQDGEQS